RLGRCCGRKAGAAGGDCAETQRIGDLMQPLSDGELHALRNLLRKKNGEEVPFVNISDARTLTDLGLASRSREGWDITPSGVARLSAEGGTAVREISSGGAPRAVEDSDD